RCRRLHREAVLAEGADRAGARGAETVPRAGGERAARRGRHPARRRDPSGRRGRPAAHAHAEGVRPASRAAGGAGSRAVARMPARPRLGLCAGGGDRVAHGGRARSPAARQAGRGGRADPHRQERGIPPGSGRLTVRAFILLLRRRIALKLTLTLVGFTGIAALAAGLYVNRALEGFAADSLEARLAAVGRVLHDETGVRGPPAQ